MPVVHYGVPAIFMLLLLVCVSITEMKLTDWFAP